MIISIKNAVNTRLFGAYEPQKIIFDLSYYTKKPSGVQTGRLFAWIDRKEVKNNCRNLTRKIVQFSRKEVGEWKMKN